MQHSEHLDQSVDQAIVLTGHVLRRLDLSNIKHHRPLVRGDDYALRRSAQWKKNGYYHLHFGMF